MEKRGRGRPSKLYNELKETKNRLKQYEDGFHSVVRGCKIVIPKDQLEKLVKSHLQSKLDF